MSEIELPEIMCLTDEQIEKLVFASEQTALRFNCPVYLVGSALSTMYPNDIDIYIACSSNTYMRLFTNFGRKSESLEDHVANMNDMKIQQAKMYKKQKDYFESHIKGWDFDVKFENIDSFMQRKGKKLRLDEIYNKLW